MARYPRPTRRGVTLMELVVVMTILIALAAIVVPLVSGETDDARVRVTTASMTQLRDVILGQYRNDMKEVVLAPYVGQPASVTRPLVLPRPGYYALHNSVTPNGPRLDMPQLRYLFVNPGTYVAPGAAESTATSYDPSTARGWRGPYLIPGTGQYPAPNAVFTRNYGEQGDPTVLDGWNNPIVIVNLYLLDATGRSTISGAELRSAGRDGILQNSDDIVVNLY